MANNVVLEIGDFLGYCDLNGVEALDTEQVQQLEDYISQCNDAARGGKELVSNATWDRLVQILKEVNPESELLTYSWEDSVGGFEDDDTLVVNNPMFSIQTVKDYECEELMSFVDRLPSNTPFDAHISIKLNGHGIRIKFKNGNFYQARSRARSSSGRDLTKQIGTILAPQSLDYIEQLSGFDMCEVRGEWVLPFSNLGTARTYNPDIKSAFTAVSSMGRESASPEEWKLLAFVAYEFIAEDMHFQSKSEEYEFLEELGFETPLSWVIPDLTKETLLDELPNIVSDCEMEVKPSDDFEGYQYYSDGLVFAINDSEVFKSLGDDGTHYKHGNMALKVGYWKQDMYNGYVQCIMWTKGKTKLSPVAILAEEEDIVRFKSGEQEKYVYSKNEVENWDALGVITASGNRVRRIPLYEPNNMAILDAYPGHILNFRYGGEAGVVPCFEDGTPLLDGRIQHVLSEEDEYSEFFEFDD